MELSLGSNKVYELSPRTREVKIQGNVFSKGRILIGRAESCDLIIAHPSVSAVHAVLEVTPQGVKVFDMNSRNGTFVNAEKVVAQNIKIGDRVNIASIEFMLKEYADTPELPPVLDALDPVKGMANTLLVSPKLPQALVNESKEEGSEAAVVEEKIPYISYPLSTDPKADKSEYIFEDAKEVYPIFKYDVSKQAVEVTILFKDQVFSVDYLPQKNATYSIVGARPKKKEIEFPYLGKDEKVNFVEIKNDYVAINRLHSYEALKLTSNGLQEVKDTTLALDSGDIVKFTNGDLEIFVRRVSAPPKVKTAPFFRRDKEFKKYILLMFLLILPPFAALNFLEVDKEELQKEKAPERIATILYKQKLTISKNDAVEKTPKKEKVAQKTPPKKVEPKKTEKPKQEVAKRPTPVKKPTPKDPGKKTAPKKQVVKKATNPTPKPRSATRRGGRPSANTATARANTATKSIGTVDVYKSADFKSTVSSLMAKGGSLSGARTATQNAGGNLNSATVGGAVSDNLQKANVSGDIGSLEGATVGKIGDSRGAEGLSAKTGIYTAGIPAETVVLGSMDPDVIRRILRENIPQFRYCYQKELEARPGSSVSGQIRLLFSIGASGHVSRAGVDGNSALPSDVRNCVVRVLRGIQFPRPLGGGTVEVKQPFNFMPQRM